MMPDYTKMEKSTVLILEQSASEADELTKIISDDFEVISFFDKDIAISFLNDNSSTISAAIINIDMALETLTKIRRTPVLQNLPILISTSYEDSKLDEELLALDVIDFLRKPFNETRVRARVKTAVKLSEAHYVINELERDELTGLFTRQAFLR